MKAADDDIDTGSAKLAGQIEGPGKLVGLDPHQPHDKLGRRAPAPADNLSYRKAFRSLVKGDDLYRKIAEHSTLFHGFGQTVQDVKRVAREHTFPKANDITLIVVLGGLDQNDAERLKPRLCSWLGDYFTITCRLA